MSVLGCLISAVVSSLSPAAVRGSAGGLVVLSHQYQCLELPCLDDAGLASGLVNSKSLRQCKTLMVHMRGMHKERPAAGMHACSMYTD